MTGEELKKIRKEVFGLTQAEFGEVIHRKLTTIHSWENNSRPIPEYMDEYIRMLAEKEMERKMAKYKGTTS